MFSRSIRTSRHIKVLFGSFAIETILQLPEYDYFKMAQLIGELRPALASEDRSDRPYDLATRFIQDDRPFHPQHFWDVCHQLLDRGIHRSKGFFWLASRDEYSLLELWNDGHVFDDP